MNEQDVLDVLVCDFQARPRGAASVFDVAPAVQSVRREADALLIDFAPEAAPAVAEYIDAERQCCRQIGWELTLAPAPRLRISGTPPQLDVLEQLFGEQMLA
ncbi:MAG TPA: hypothetical protein VKV26_15420 [Dehalococcoidia bacterium]|nr:hypothetical protein [Dehalococcoidia bacterium]